MKGRPGDVTAEFAEVVGGDHDVCLSKVCRSIINESEDFGEAEEGIGEGCLCCERKVCVGRCNHLGER